MMETRVRLYIRLHPRLTHQMGRMPTDAEMARYLGCTEEDIAKIKKRLNCMDIKKSLSATLVVRGQQRNRGDCDGATK